ncbi:MAG: amidophosphoribosyltransferase [Bacteroidales bacterium]|nr:amidophosphoribosyltransferase [Bacteroidales bacterium]
MGGLFGVISKRRCVTDLFYGTDYHSHLGTKRGGMASINPDGSFVRSIHSLKQSYFRVKFESELYKFEGNSGIGVISDNESQPIVMNSHLGRFAAVTVSKISNIANLEQKVLDSGMNFTEMSDGTTNATELVCHLITEGATFAEGIDYMHHKVYGSCTLLLLTPEGIIAARDFNGRTPLCIGKKEDAYAVANEDFSFCNLGYEKCYELGPGEAVLITADGFKQILKPRGRLHICSFLWIYYGYPSATYEGVNVDDVRYNLGSLMGRQDDTPVDIVSSIPDSGTCMAIGYAQGRGIPYRNAVVKYTPTWPRSFMPSDQSMRDVVAKMKLIPNYSIMKGRSVAFCDDSIVRGTQLRDNVEAFKSHGSREVHIRISCPPLIFPCPFLNYSASKSPLEFISRRVIKELEGSHDKNLQEYAMYGSDRYMAMVDAIRKELKMNTLKFNNIDNLVAAVGLDKSCICTHCFDGSDKCAI